MYNAENGYCTLLLLRLHFKLVSTYKYRNSLPFSLFPLMSGNVTFKIRSTFATVITHIALKLRHFPAIFTTMTSQRPDGLVRFVTRLARVGPGLFVIVITLI